MNRKKRDSGIELLRIVLMALIILWHYLVYGQQFFIGLENGGIDFDLVCITPILVFPVDCFIFISGFYGIKLKRETFISFLLLLIFYSASTFIINGYLSGNFSCFGLITTIFPVSTNCWWFFTIYLMLMIISPVLNKASEFGHSSFLKILILLGIFYMCPFSLLLGTKTGCIGDLSLFIFLYMLGRYLSLYPNRIPPNNRYKIFCIALIVSIGFVTAFYYLHLPSWVIRAISYNNPFIILVAITVFYIFKGLPIKTSNGINLVSSTVFASYLVTESSLRYNYIDSVVKICGDNIWLYIISSVLTIGLICPIEIIRRNLFSGCVVRIAKLSRNIIP